MTQSGYREEKRVSFLQIDKNRCMTPAALLSALQEMAIDHADSLGYSIDYMLEHHWFWSVVNWHLRIYHMPRYHERITLQTWSDKCARFQANRSFTICDETGRHLVDVSSRWMFLDLEKRKPTNVPAEMVENYHCDLPAAIPDERFFLPKEPQGEQIAEREILVTRRDTDTNGHANNVKYLEWVMDDIPDEIYAEMALRDLCIVYRKECLRGDTVTIKTFLQDTEEGKAVDSFLYEGGTVMAQVLSIWG